MDINPLRRSPIQQVVDAIARVIHPDGPFFVSVLDCDVDAMVSLARQLTFWELGKDRILFLQTPFRKPEYLPWVELFESAVEANGAGVVCDLDEVVEAIRGHREIPNRMQYQVTSPSYDLGNMQISPFTKPKNRNRIEEEKKCLRHWARLEALADYKYSARFTRLVSGARPWVVVFDDYNNYIRFDQSSFIPAPKKRLSVAAGDYFHTEVDPSKKFYEVLEYYCRNLNNLLIAYEVRAPKLWVCASGKSDYAHVAQVLPMEWLEEKRKFIAAFIVDLEWLPTVNHRRRSGLAGNNVGWSDMGYRAIHLLSECFPEIPNFVYTGERPYEKLQDALAHGAFWCFRKAQSHHGPGVANSDQLTCIELDRHLKKAGDVRHGAFSELPYPGQLIIDPTDSASKALINKLHLRIPIGTCSKGKVLQRLVARLFPDGTLVRPVKVFDSGKSKAQAAFIVSPSRNDVPYATRFMKVAPWLEIQREYLAYQRAIRPRLNTHVANLVERPVLVDGVDGGMPLGTVIYSMAGLPEGYVGLEPLYDLLKTRCQENRGGKDVGLRIQETLQQVLLPLYGSAGTKLKTTKRPLWDWFGEVLPPAFTGVLVPLNLLDVGETKPFTVQSWREQGYKKDAAWLLAARDAENIRKLANSDPKLSPWSLSGERVLLSGFELLEVNWANDADSGDITIAHPDLGLRIRLRGKADDIRRRFGAIWNRSGLPVDIEAVIDKTNRKFQKIERRVLSAFFRLELNSKEQEGNPTTGQCLKLFETAAGFEMLSDPFDLFGGEKGIPFFFTMTAHQSPIHGDLNLHNILFAGKTGPGWLIDFERSGLQGMPAFDLAKLETEVWHHYIFPALEDLSSGSANKNDCCLKLLRAAQISADVACDSGEMFVSLVRTEKIIADATDDLMVPVRNLLHVIAVIRDFGKSCLELDETEMRWALAVYFFVAIKFADEEQPWRSILSFCSSARYLARVAPPVELKENGAFWYKSFNAIAVGSPSSADKKDLDALLIEMTRKPISLCAFTRDMAKRRDDCEVEWPESIKQRWDLASTGAITNITPIFGYLWLMVKAWRSRSKEAGGFSVVVPKISSPGSSCGTVDILESGGMTFPHEPDAIVSRCQQEGGVLCHQHDALTPIDQALMKRRKETNTMKNVALVYASILTKKIAMGCTHAIVDVKVGRDSKIMAPWMSEGDIKKFVTNVDPDKLLPDVASRFAKLLVEEMGLAGKVSKEKVGTGEDSITWVKQSPNWISDKTPSDVPALGEVRWFFTNSDVPQCRAIGRQLTLLHLDDLILGAYGDTLLGNENQYAQLYKKVLPALCDLGCSDDVWLEVQDQWKRLKARLPLWKDFAAINVFKGVKALRNDDDDEYFSKYSFEKSLELDTVEHLDLRVITFALGPYHLVDNKENSQLLTRIDAWRLDSFFDWLCGDDEYDPEVGIYLHRLPGEEVEKLDEVPFISVFFRPSRCRESEVIQRVRCFLSDGVRLGYTQ